MKFLDKILGSNILYYPGCLTKFVAKDLKEKYERLLRKIGIDFITLSDLEVCCGSPALKAGYFDDFNNLVKKNLKIFQEHSVKKIITNCPACFMIFKKEYPKVLGKEWDISVLHITEVLNEKLKIKNSKLFRNWKLEIGNSSRRLIAYHDPCHLGRQMGVYEEPREVIKSCGYKIIEMELNRIESFCCGGGGGVKANEPELANKIAQDRINQARKTKADLLCTACPLCYLHLKENAQDLKVIELVELFDEEKYD